MAIDAYIKFEGGVNQIKGESLDSKLTSSAGWSALQEVTFSANNGSNIGSAGGGGSAGKVAFEDFQITKFVDAASPNLFAALCAGDHYDKVYIDLRKGGGGDSAQDPYLEYIFAMVYVTDISTAVSDGDEATKETIKFAYGAMQISYKAQDAKGKLGSPVIKAWSRSVNKATLAVAKT